MKLYFTGMKSSAFVMGLSLMALTACNGMGTIVTPNRGNVKADNLEEGDSWKATLSSVNTRFGSATGKATFKIVGGKLIVEIETSGLKEVAHIQAIRSGACPMESSDVNTDGIVDGSESGATTANAILALDGDLSSTDAGADGYPTSDVTGNYLYSQSADQIVLGDQDLTGKIVLIHGIAESETLPDTVKGLGTDDQHETMPVLCGTIMEEQGPQQQQHQQYQQFMRE